MISSLHLISMGLTLFLVTLVGLYSLRQVKTASDFSVGGRQIGYHLVAGTIIGTMVGGASTIGTAQLAFRVGLSAWWFTLGGGIACLVLGLFLARPLRKSGVTTVSQYMARVYGPGAGLTSSAFSSAGIFLNIVGQVLSAVALMTSMFKIGPLGAALVAIVLIISYVIFGGVWGTGLVGVFKVLLLYVSLTIAGVLAYSFLGGWSGITTTFPTQPWLNLFGQGYSKDLAAGFAMVVGVLSTQTYLQAMFSGKDVAASKKGAIVSAFLIPPIGIAGILVGLYMRANFPYIESSHALPLFILQYLDPWLGGVVLATLLLSLVGTGAGLTLGISTMLSQDIYRAVLWPQASEKQVLLVTRSIIILVTLATLLFVSGNLNSLILKWSFLSMALRGATICFPLLGAIFLHNRISARSGYWAIVLGPTSVLIWVLLGLKGLDPLYVGMGVSFLVLFLGYTKARKDLSA